MPNNIDQEQLQDLANTFYETLAKNRYFSSQNKSATALEELAGQMIDLNQNLKSANASSTRLTTSLNWLTFAAVMIAFFALGLQAFELFFYIPAP